MRLTGCYMPPLPQLAILRWRTAVVNLAVAGIQNSDRMLSAKGSTAPRHDHAKVKWTSDGFRS